MKEDKNETIVPETIEIVEDVNDTAEAPSEMLNDLGIDFESTDEDMPEPETADYGNQNDATANARNARKLYPTDKFMELLNTTIGTLPYGAILKNNAGEQIKLSDMFKFIEAKINAKALTVGEMNTIINFIATCPFGVVRPLMEIIENGDRQSELWTLAPTE